MAFNPTEEGDDLNAASINDRFAEVTAEMNALKPDQIARRRLGQHHTPDLLDPYNLFTLFSGGSDDALVDVERYDNTIPGPLGGPSGGIENYLELFAPSGPYGPYVRTPGAGNVAEEGWLIPRSVGAPEGMNVVLNSAYDLDTPNLQGLKVNAWIDIRDMLDEPNPEDPDANASAKNGDWAVYLGIGIRDSAGTRHVILRSVRRISSLAGQYGPLATMTTIQENDLTAGTLNGTVQEVFGAVLSGLWDAGVNQHGNVEVEIKQFAITLEPLRGGVLE